MSAPALTVQQQGVGVVTADNYNTFCQTCDIISELRGFVGIQGIQVYVRGFTAPADGGQGNFYWNSSAVAPVDDGKNIIVPPGAGMGCWQRLDGNITGLIVSASQPAMAASGTPFTNPFAYPVLVTISGGTVSAISVGGTLTGLTSGTVVVGVGQTITLTYSAAPIWVWFGLGI